MPLLLLPAILSVSARSALADAIYLKGDSGEVIEGVIDHEKSDDNRVFIRTPAGLLPVLRSRIDKIEVRENVPAAEREGDLALQKGDLDAALKQYLKAHEEAPDDEVIAHKIADIKERIERSKRQQYAGEFADIDSAIKRRAFAEASVLARKLVDKAPDDASRNYCLKKLSEVYLAQARDYTNMVNYLEAEKAYRRAIEASPQSAVAELELAKLIEEAPTRRKEAFELYREGLTYAAKDPTLVEKGELLRHRFDEAQLYYRESLYREAAELFWGVLQSDDEGKFPKATEFIVRALSNVRTKLAADNEENRRAIEILKGVLERDPSRADARYILGKICCERNQWPETMEYMEVAVRSLVGPDASSDRAEARYCLAQAYRRQHRLQEASVQLQALLVAQPTRYDALCDLGEIYAEELEYQKALGEFSNAISADPGIYRAYLGAARALRQLNRYEEARQNYKKLIELRGDHPAYFYELGLTYTDLNKHEDAREYFTKAVSLLEEKEGDKPSTETQEILSRSYTQLGLGSVAERNYYEAIQNFDKALASRGDIAAAYDGKGQAYRELGKLDEAEKFFKKAVDHEPGNPNFLLDLGIFFHKYRKDRERALPYYMGYFEHGGSDPQVRDWIRECGGTPPRVS